MFNLMRLLRTWKLIRLQLKSSPQQQELSLNSMSNKEIIWTLENHFLMLILKVRKKKVKANLNNLNLIKNLQSQNKKSRRPKHLNKQKLNRLSLPNNKLDHRRQLKRKKVIINLQHPILKDQKQDNHYQDWDKE